MTLRLLASLPTQLVLSILAAFGLGMILQEDTVRVFYTISHFFVDFLMFFLPYMVFSFIFRALTNIRHGSAMAVGLILGGVTLSNLFALWTSYGTAVFFLGVSGTGHCAGFADKFASTITPYFNLPLPHLIRTDKAMLLGVVLALLSNFLIKNETLMERIRTISIKMSDGITLVLQRFFIPLLPAYVFGFCLKLSFDGALGHLFKAYGHIFITSMILLVLYLFLMYMVAAGFSITRALNYIKNMMPAGLTGFSTMSSAATMPVTLECTEVNTKDRNYTDLAIPSTSNIHMIGDDLTIVMTALSLLVICGQGMPSLYTFAIFSIAFCVAKLSCVGIPGASVLVVLPVLQQFLGFTPEMISMITTIYILQDPFGTAANVMGNGALAIILQKPFKTIAQKD